MTTVAEKPASLPTSALTPQQLAHFQTEGYVTGIDVFAPTEVTRMNQEMMKLGRCLQDNETFLDTREWHESSRFLYEVCTDARILDKVQSILGSDFFLWGSQFFAKEPYSPTAVGWHQDAYYWPLRPHKSVTAWVAFLDSNDANGAMRVIPRSHKAGPIKHVEAPAGSVLSLSTDEGAFNPADAKTLTLKAGQMSLHDDNIIHGSEANKVGHWRMGFTIRYSANEVRNTAASAENPWLVYQVRGEDRFHHPGHVQGKIPEARYGRRALVRDNSQRR